MFRFLLLTAILAIAPIVCAAEQTEKNQPDELTQRIWKEIQGKPNPRIMDNFEVLEGFPLLVNGKGISLNATVLFTLIDYELGLSNTSMATNAAAKKAKKEAGKTAREIQEALNDVWKITRATERVIEAASVEDKNRFVWKTSRVENSYLIQLYMDDSHSLAEAVNLFAKDYFLNVNLEKQEHVTWKKLKEAVDKKIPVILGEGDEVKVAVGYYVEGEKGYVLLYDPQQAEYGIQTGTENIKNQRKTNDPKILNMYREMMKDKIPMDYSIDLQKSCPLGVSFVPFSGLSGKLATYIYGWRADMETAYPALLKRLGVKEDTTK